MASFCSSSILRLPAKIPTFNGAIVRQPFLILRPSPLLFSPRLARRRIRAIPPQKFVYPDPIPEFPAAETEKFKAELLRKLSKEKEAFGNDLQTVVNVCAEVFCEFLHEEYGGPGTLLIEPFTEMMVALKEKNLPGAPLAARASLLRAQKYVDQDWKNWNFKSEN